MVFLRKLLALHALSACIFVVAAVPVSIPKKLAQLEQHVTELELKSHVAAKEALFSLTPKQKMKVKLFRKGPKVVYDDADEVEEQGGDHHHHHHLANDLKQRRAKVLLSSFEKNTRSKDKLKNSQEKPKHRCRIGQPQDADLETYSIDMMHKIDRLRPDYNGQHL